MKKTARSIRIAITGGRGRWAQPVAKFLRSMGLRVNVFSRKGGPNVALLSSLQGATLAGFQAVFDMAWPNVPATALKNDRRGPSHVQDILDRISKIKKNPPLYIFPSTCAVYGETRKNRLATENTPCHPKGNYARQKILAEKIIKKHALKHGNPWVILRISNLYGTLHPTQKPQGIIPKLVQDGYLGQPTCLWGSGKNTKDFLHLEDFCQALRLILCGRLQGMYNVCYGKPTRIQQVAEIVGKTISRRVQIKFAPAKRWDVKKSSFGNYKIKKAIPWSPKISIEKGIRRMLAAGKEPRSHSFLGESSQNSWLPCKPVLRFRSF